MNNIKELERLNEFILSFLKKYYLKKKNVIRYLNYDQKICMMIIIKV